MQLGATVTLAVGSSSDELLSSQVCQEESRRIGTFTTASVWPEANLRIGAVGVDAIP